VSGCRRHHRIEAKTYDACCGHCVDEAELFLAAFDRLGFSGKIDMAEHHANTGRAAVALLRQHRYWASADLLEAAIGVWNELPRNQRRPPGGLS
jgi:hypothetical protein